MRLIAEGKDPYKPVTKHRFSDVLPLWIAKEKPTWTNAHYATRVEQEVRKYAEILLDLDVNLIEPPDILKVFHHENLWVDHNPLAVRLRGYIEQVIGYAMAANMRDKAKGNPAVWKYNFEFLLPKPSEIHKPEAEPSLHHTEIPPFMRQLRKMEGLKFRCLDVLIHAALRSNEAYGARRREFDFDVNIWTLPPERMKERREHTVPLVPQVLRLIQSLPRAGELVFGKLTDKLVREALSETMEAAKREWFDLKTGKLISVRGFRASLATWAGEAGYDETLIDVAIAHMPRQGSDTLKRYQRSDKVELRREMMIKWSNLLEG
jgi:integrase